MTTKTPLSVYLDPELMRALAAYADRRDKSRSLIAEAAIASFLSPDADEQREAAIAKRLEEVLAPRWLRIGGYWFPRGGMPIDIFYQSGPPPENIWLPDQGVAPYRGRG